MSIRIKSEDIMISKFFVKYIGILICFSQLNKAQVSYSDNFFNNSYSTPTAAYPERRQSQRRIRIRRRTRNWNKQKMRARGKLLEEALNITIKRKELVAAKLSQVIESDLWSKLKGYVGRSL